MYRLNLYLIFFCTAVTLQAAGQTARTISQPSDTVGQPTRTISGLITSAEDGTILEGVRVQAKGSGMISGSQQDGAYYIPVTDADTVLVFSRDDLASQEVRLTGNTDLNIQMHKAGHSSFSLTSDSGKNMIFYMASFSVDWPINRE